MSNQIVISSGAKVRNLDGVLTASTGVVSSVGYGLPNGVATLDGSGKIPVTQLPNSVMEFKGVWNAATNTPTLADGTGNAGDVYLCNVAGTVNFGSGPISFAVGDYAVYTGTVWARSSGATGTVTSVAVTESGDALSITGSPITTSGTINIGFAGSSAQYVAGDGSLVTFPALTGYVPYTGATQTLDMGAFDVNARGFKVNGTAGNGHIDFKHQSGVPMGSASSTTLFADVNGDMAWKNDHNYFTYLATHANTADRTYTFPNASGTLALTSDLSGYLPLTGGTLTGALSIATFSYLTSRISLNNGASGGNVWTISSGNANNSINNGLFTIFNETTSGNLFVLSPTGKLAIGANLGTINPADAFAVYDTNTVLKAVDLTGNSSSVTLQATNTAAYVNAGYVFGGTAIPLILRTGNTTRLTIAATGAATFSSSMTASSIIKSGGTSSQFLKADGSIDSNTYLTTSSASSTYLPLTGGTLTGALNGTSATFSGTLTVNGDSSIFNGGTANNFNTYALGIANTKYLVFASTAASQAGGRNWSGGIGADSSENIFLGSYNNLTFGAGTLATRMTILGSNGNVGIGTSSPTARLDLGNNVGSANTANQIALYSLSGTALYGFGVSAAQLNYISGGNHSFYNSATTSQQMIITSSGNVGIGTSTPDCLFQARGLDTLSANTRYLKAHIGGAGTWGVGSYEELGIGYSGIRSIYTSGDNWDLAFSAGTSTTFAAGTQPERMRITSGGLVLIGTTSGTAAYKLKVDNGASGGIMAVSTGSGDANFLSTSSAIGYHYYADNGTSAKFYVVNGGQIYSTSTSISAISDIRYKENIKELETGLEQILALKPSRFDWKNGKGTGKKNVAGFIAQDIEEILPDLVDEWKETMDATESFKSIRMTDLIPTLVKAIQEQQKQIEELKAKIN